MSLAIGSRVGPYEVLAPLGAGGMGEVYRARDTRLDRTVAIKILPESVAEDPERIARFEREARTLAALNHPNIAMIHGFEQGLAPGVAQPLHALVMELVEGPTLADRIAQGPLPIDEALAIAKQILDALEAAHDHGIVHRDLKPANIKLRRDGAVKVLDFGLAKAVGGDGSPGAQPLSLSPTITSPALMTGIGIILGTAAYMAPEQARGKPVDKRADIWAFGCVLYEMLSGRQTFQGEEVTDVLARVIEREPDASAMPPDTPVAIRRLLRRCLTKDRRRRLADAADARLEIDDALTSPAPDAMANVAPARPTPLWRRALPVAVASLAVLAAGYTAWTLRPQPRRSVARFAITLPESDIVPSSRLVALSADGTRLAYAANSRLYLRALEQLEPVPIVGSDRTIFSSARNPFFSPDGQWIAFWETGQVKKISVSGGAPVTVFPVSPPPSGVMWAADNTMLMGRGADGIWRVSAEGGTPERIITMNAGERAHGPELLPDGRTVLFTLATTPNWDQAQIVAHSLDTGRRRTLITGGTDARYVPTGHLVYALRDALLAVAFDAGSLTVRGGPVPVVERVARPSGGSSTPGAAFAVSADGTLAYLSSEGIVPTRRTLVWVDRRGREEEIAAPAQRYTHPRLAPDGTRVAVEMTDEADNADVWVWDFARRTATRVTSDPAPDREPVWTPDSQQLVFTSWRTGTINLFRQAVNGTGHAVRLTDLTRQARAALTISPDGRHVLFRGTEAGNSNLMMVDLPPNTAAASPGPVGPLKTLVKTSFEEYNGEISPDGGWIAYQSNSSGRFEVYVRPFPNVESREWLVSTAGGAEPLWSRDGRELFYRRPDGAIMRVSVALGQTWNPGTPTPLIDAARYARSSSESGVFLSRTYDISPDGRRFLMIKNADAPPAAAPRIIVVQNWTEELKQRVPTR